MYWQLIKPIWALFGPDFCLSPVNIYTRMEIAGPTKLLAPPNPESEEIDRQNNDGKIPTTIGVVAKQWAWDFHYPNKEVTHELHLPVNQQVRLILQSEDVLHGFYVPQFRIKQDIIPSRVGKYKLHDSQLSGTYFAINEADVYVDTAEDYQKWLAEGTGDRTMTANLAAIEYAHPSKRAFNSHYPLVTS